MIEGRCVTQATGLCCKIELGDSRTESRGIDVGDAQTCSLAISHDKLENTGYHRRSLVETKMHCFKLLGQRVAARTLDRQISELKVRAVILNRFSEIGTPMTVRFA